MFIEGSATNSLDLGFLRSTEYKLKDSNLAGQLQEIKAVQNWGAIEVIRTHLYGEKLNSYGVTVKAGGLSPPASCAYVGSHALY